MAKNLLSTSLPGVESYNWKIHLSDVCNRIPKTAPKIVFSLRPENFLLTTDTRVPGVGRKEFPAVTGNTNTNTNSGMGLALIP